MADNLGIDEAFAAAVREHLKAIGEIRPDEPGEAKEGEADAANAPEMGEANAIETSRTEVETSSVFFT